MSQDERSGAGNQHCRTGGTPHATPLNAGLHPDPLYRLFSSLHPGPEVFPIDVPSAVVPLVCADVAPVSVASHRFQGDPGDARCSPQRNPVVTRVVDVQRVRRNDVPNVHASSIARLGDEGLPETGARTPRQAGPDLLTQPAAVVGPDL